MWRLVLIGCILKQAIAGTVLKQQELPKELMEHVVTNRVQYPVPVAEVQEQVKVHQTVQTVEKPYPVYVPQPYPVYIEKKVPVTKHYLVEKRMPFQIKPQADKNPVKTYKLYVEKRIPYYIEKHVPYKVKRYPVHYPIEKEVLYPVVKEVPYEVKVHVEKPVPYRVEKPVPHHVEKIVPYPVIKEVPFPVNVPYRVEIEVPYKVKMPKENKSEEGFSQEDSFGRQGGWRPVGILGGSSGVEDNGLQHSKQQEDANSRGLGQYYESTKHETNNR